MKQYKKVKYYCLRKSKKNMILALTALFAVMLMSVPTKLAIAYYQTPTPQAILTLGGDENREKFTALFAQFYPDLKIWISSGISYIKARAIFQNAGIPNSRLHFDYRATDTVTNFTTLVGDFQKQHIQHLFLITSESHMPRAKAIAILVLGSRGIAFTPVSVPSKATQPEDRKSVV